MGSLRKMGRGVGRNTIIAYLNAAGAHTSSWPLADAVTASSATYSLSTVNGASLLPVAFQCWIVVVVRTCPGLITSTRTPYSRNASPRPGKRPSGPALLDPYTKLDRRNDSP